MSLRSEELTALQRRLHAGGLLSRGLVLLGPEGVGKTTFAAEFIAFAGNNPAEALYVDAREVGSRNLARLVFAAIRNYAQERLRRERDRFEAFVDLARTDTPRATIQLVKLLARHLDERFVLMVDHLESLHTPGGDWCRAEDRHLWKALVEVLERVEGWMLLGCSRIETAEYETLRYPLTPLRCETLVSLLDRHPALSSLHPRNRQALLERVRGNLAVLPLLNDLVGERLRAVRRRRAEPLLNDQSPEPLVLAEWQSVLTPILQRHEELTTASLARQCFDELHPAERQLLSRMTLVQQPWSWDWLLRLGEGDEATQERHLEWLARSSLIESVPLSDGSLGYRVGFPLLEVLKQHPVEDSHRRREWLQTLAQKLEGSIDPGTSLALRREAGQLLFQAEEYARALDQLLPVARDLARGGEPQDARQQLEAFLDFKALTLLDRERVLQLLQELGVVCRQQGKYEAARLYHDREHRLSKTLNDPLREAQALSHLAEVHLAEKDWKKAVACLTGRLELVRSRIDRDAEVETLGRLGQAHAAAGASEESIRCYEEQLHLARQQEDPAAESNALGHLGAALSGSGKVHKSVSLYEQRLALLEKTRDRVAQGQTLVSLAAALIQSGQPARAIPHLEQRLLMAREDRDLRTESQMLMNLGSAYFSLGQSEKALRFFEERLQRTRELDDRKGEGQVLCNLGMALGELGQIDKAMGLLEQSLRIGQELRDTQLTRVAGKQMTKLRAARSG